MRRLSTPGIPARLIAVGSLVLFAVIGVVAFVLARGASDYVERAANQRAHLGVDLLAGVGTALPRLTKDSVSDGFAPAEVAALDAAVMRGRRAGLVSDVNVWDTSGQLSYSSTHRFVGRQPVERDLWAALAGTGIARRQPREADQTQAGRRGLLDAFEPLRDTKGEIYGSVEITLPLTPILAEAASLRNRIFVFFLVGSLALWCVLLPLTLRMARTVAASWLPGRRRTLRVVRRALAQDRVELVYQPQVSPRSGRCVAVEALVRLRCDGQLRTPDTFLHAVEGSHLDRALADRVIDLALAQLATWRSAGHDLRMSINLTAQNLAERDLPGRISAAVGRHECDPANITFEVTETGVLEEIGPSRDVVRAIAALGVDLSIDDFGAGHSSISRLHRLPVTEVKIDRSFVMPSDPRSRAYVAAIVGFARGLGLRVVAEGVENAEALHYLTGLGCDLTQGYHVCRPKPAGEIGDWLVRNEVPSATMHAA